MSLGRVKSKKSMGYRAVSDARTGTSRLFGAAASLRQSAGLWRFSAVTILMMAVLVGASTVLIRQNSRLVSRPSTETKTLTGHTELSAVINSGAPSPVSSSSAKQATEAASAQGTSATARRPFGLSAGDLVDLDSSGLERRLAGFDSLGIDWVRLDVPWSVVQAAGPGSYSWAQYDQVVSAVRAHGQSLLLVLDYSPSWARSAGCADTERCAPSNPDAFASYAGQVAARYAGQGVSAYEIWNEPNKAGFWGPRADPAAYTRLLLKSSSAIRATQPSAQIITGGLAPSYTEGGDYSPVDFLSGVYAAGGRTAFTAVGHHPYCFPALPSQIYSWSGWSVMSQLSSSLRSVMVAHGDSSKRIWATEYGAPTGGPGVGASLGNQAFDSNPDHVDEAMQSRLATSGVGLWRSYSWSGPLFWYGYIDLGTSQNSNENFFGLLRHDGSLKPAYYSYQSAITGS
jgi:polysaccharide biosynthesis protein PslG